MPVARAQVNSSACAGCAAHSALKLSLLILMRIAFFIALTEALAGAFESKKEISAMNSPGSMRPSSLWGVCSLAWLTAWNNPEMVKNMESDSCPCRRIIVSSPYLMISEKLSLARRALVSLVIPADSDSRPQLSSSVVSDIWPKWFAIGMYSRGKRNWMHGVQ